MLVAYHWRDIKQQNIRILMIRKWCLDDTLYIEYYVHDFSLFFPSNLHTVKKKKLKRKRNENEKPFEWKCNVSEHVKKIKGPKQCDHRKAHNHSYRLHTDALHYKNLERKSSLLNRMAKRSRGIKVFFFFICSQCSALFVSLFSLNIRPCRRKWISFFSSSFFHSFLKYHHYYLRYVPKCYP